MDVLGCFSPQGNLGAIHPVDSWVAGRGDVGRFHFTTRNYAHLHQSRAQIFTQRKMIHHCPLTHAQLGQRFPGDTHLPLTSQYSLPRLAFLWLFVLCLANHVQAQVLDNNFLNGRYGFRQLLISTNPAGQPIEARSMVGIISFDGRGNLSFQGTRNVGNNAPATFTGGGTYVVSPAGLVTMTNPLDLSSQLNARLGDGLLLGSTTDSAGNIFDLFLAAPLPSLPTSNATFQGSYAGLSLEVPNGIFFNVKNAFLRFNSAGNGTIGLVNASGQTTQSGRRILQQSIGATIYSVSSDGSGQLVFPPSAPLPAASQLVLGDKQIFIAAGGDMVLGGSTAQGAHDLFFAMRTSAAGASAPPFQGLFFAAGLRVDQSRPAAFSGALNALANGRSVWSRRQRLPGANLDVTQTVNYSLPEGGIGSLANNRLALSANGNVFLSSGVGFVETENYEFLIGVRARPLTGAGVFLNPAGILNSASFAPVTNPIAPGQFITLFGSGLGPATPLVAPTIPFPTNLGGISVTVQGRLAPLYFVSANQISALVPFATSGISADIVVRAGNQESNRVTVAVSRSSPGVYSLSQNGIGQAAMLKADFSVVSPANPARPGETILIYLTGLGALDPPIGDGAAAPTNALSRVTGNVNVYIGGQRATVSFAGAAPGFAGLYQVNAVIPPNAPTGSAVPLAIETQQSFHEMVDLPIAPAL
jgi:uncharacterized protein (TIGR03437 family)